jgi:hypothetical protein
MDVEGSEKAGSAANPAGTQQQQPEAVVLQHAPGGADAAPSRAAARPVRFFVWRPAPAPAFHDPDLPVLWFANGAYVEARWYSELARRLSAGLHSGAL